MGCFDNMKLNFKVHNKSNSRTRNLWSSDKYEKQREKVSTTFLNYQTIFKVVYNGVVEATMSDLRGLIVLAHQLYISIPISEELMQGLDLNLPPMPAFATRCSSNLPRLKQRPHPPPLQNNNIMYKPPALKQPQTSPNYYDRSLLGKKRLCIYEKSKLIQEFLVCFSFRHLLNSKVGRSLRNMIMTNTEDAV